MLGYEKNWPQNYECLSIGLNNLGHLLYLQGNLDEAEEYYRQSLKVSQSIGRQAGPETLTALDNLGVLLSDHVSYVITHMTVG